MILTVYYAVATFVQSWRIKSIYNKISSKLAEKTSVVFYNLSSNNENDFNTSSELCINHSQARISDVLWNSENQRNYSITPPQIVHLGPWITFPESASPNFIPFEFYSHQLESNSAETEESSVSSRIHLLLETGIVPASESDANSDIIMIEDYGKLLAWKVDSHFAVILETDLNQFIRLIMSTFMQDNFLINDRLPLIRIESILHEGSPQPFDLLKNHLRKQLISRAMRHLSANDWEKHLTGLRSLSVLASQATEFEYNKNRTEGKTGVVKPDLIPSTSSLTKTPNENVPSPNKQDLTPSSNKSELNFTTQQLQKSTISSKASVSPVKSSESSAKPLTSHSKPKSPSPIKLPLSSTTPSTSSSSGKAKVSTSPKKVIGESSNSSIDKKNPSPNNSRKSSSKSMPTENLSTPTTVSLKSSESTTVTPSSSGLTADKSKLIKKNDDDDDFDGPIIPRPIPKASEVSAKNPSGRKRPTLVRTKGSISLPKPPNVLVYSDSVTLRDNIIETLKNVLQRDMYAIYPLLPHQIEKKIWIENTSLLIVCGAIESPKAEILVEYFLKGGKMLSLCSDLLHIIVPTYRTAEVRENELAQFSYDKWQKVKMMHHIFCYQPSPIKKHFSTEAEESNGPALTKKPALVCPRSVEVKDLQGELHNVDVKVLGSEETWNTPSLLLVNDVKSGGKAVFSQVHLEVDPIQYASDEIKCAVLKQNDKARLEILSDLLSSHLDIDIQSNTSSTIVFKNAYFLGHHEPKFELLSKLKSKMESENLIKLSNISLQFCGKGDQPPTATTELLPVLTILCPDDFSTVKYFDNLKTQHIGRLVIYAPIISSTQHIVNELTLTHGTAVIARQQTSAFGRTGNQWLSPEGCVMFSLQVHIPLNSILGQKLSLFQHLIVVSVVNSILRMKGFENLDIGIKWPNDIYGNGMLKIGGVLLKTQIMGTDATCNIGCGFNLSNSNPTTCLNDMIKEYNKNNNKNLPLLNYEETLARIFTEIERLLNRVQKGDLALFYELYYKYWLNQEQEVDLYDINGQSRPGKIVGIDEFGFLEVQLSNGKIESVQPGDNTFDMLKGLILPINMKV